MKRIVNLFILLFVLVLTIACGGNDASSGTAEAETDNTSTTLTDLSPEEATGDYVYNVTIGDYIELIPDNTILVVDKLPGVPVEDHRPGLENRRPLTVERGQEPVLVASRLGPPIHYIPFQ